mmetsp:Transcript_16827/g.34056  ORF Transcript_16827/g.34056 Transcript_16827/m.34056 type:complete len:286 (-) Transcript_16827:506-1363(-)
MIWLARAILSAAVTGFASWSPVFEHLPQIGFSHRSQRYALDQNVPMPLLQNAHVLPAPPEMSFRPLGRADEPVFTVLWRLIARLSAWCHSSFSWTSSNSMVNDFPFVHTPICRLRSLSLSSDSSASAHCARGCSPLMAFSLAHMSVSAKRMKRIMRFLLPEILHASVSRSNTRSAAAFEISTMLYFSFIFWYLDSAAYFFVSSSTSVRMDRMMRCEPSKALPAALPGAKFPRSSSERLRYSWNLCVGNLMNPSMSWPLEKNSQPIRTFLSFLSSLRSLVSTSIAL